MNSNHTQCGGGAGEAQGECCPLQTQDDTARALGLAREWTRLMFAAAFKTRRNAAATDTAVEGGGSEDSNPGL